MSLDVNKVNTQWQKALKKEVQRASHHPKAPKGQRWVVPTRDANLMPFDGRTRPR